MKGRITYSTLPLEMKKIANDSLGEGVLRSMLDYSNTYHCVGKISNGVMVGFALYHFVEQQLLGGEVFRTGVIDCVCVSVSYRKSGFGKAITSSVLRKMSTYGVDRIEAVVKVPEYDDGGIDKEPGYPASGSRELFTQLGFTKTKVYKDYYRGRSKRSGYNCVLCGEVPDTCKGIMYVISDS